MFSRRMFLCVALAALFFPLSGCGKKGPPPPPRIALMADAGGFSDRSFNQTAAAGMADCAAETGVDLSTAAPVSAADYESELTLLATQNFDAVIAVGAPLAGDLSKVARRFEGTHFAIIGAVVNQPNVDSITFKEQDGSFLAGALAALVTHTKRIAFLGGVDAPRLEAAEAGFIAGAREVDPRVRVNLRFVGSFEDRAAAKNAARALYAGGADIIYVVAGKAGLGAIEAAKESRSGYAIGVDSDQDSLAPGKVLTSVVKRVYGAATRVCLETIAQKPMSGHIAVGLAENGIGLTHFAYTRAVVGERNIARVDRLRRAIVAGVITPPATPDELVRFRPVPVP